MSISKTLNGNTRVVPENEEQYWGTEVTNILVDTIDLVNPTITLASGRNKLTFYRYNSAFQNVSASTGSTPIDFDAGFNVKVTLSSTTTISFSSARDGERYFLFLKQDATGGRTISWPSNIKWRGASAPTLTGSANSRDVVCVMYNLADDIYLGEYALNYA